MELNRYELAAVKRTAQNVKMLRNKLEKVTEKYNQIASEKAGLEEEIENWETPIRKKYGFSSEEILSGEADRMIAEAGQPQAAEDPAPNEWEPAETATPSVEEENEMMY